MKKIILPLVLTLSFFLISCETETNETATEDFYNVKATTNSQNNATPEELLENSLQWTSYLIVKVLTNNPELQDDFTSIIDQNDAVNLNNLFEDGITDSDFKVAFSGYLYDYIYDDIYGTITAAGGCPDSQREKPNLPIPTGGDSSGNDATENRLANFLNYIQNQNCIEIYMPYALNFSDDDFFSSSHPLNNDADNEGIFFDFNPPGCDSFETTSLNIRPISEKVQNNLFIARPYRELGNCSYSDYALLDFTVFFN